MTPEDRKQHARSDFHAALSNLGYRQSNYNKSCFQYACEQLVMSDAATSTDGPNDLALEDRLAIQEAFGIRASEQDTLYEIAVNVVHSTFDETSKSL